MKEIQLIYNVALISAVQQSGSVLYTFMYVCMYIYTHTQFHIFSIIVAKKRVYFTYDVIYLI